MAVSTSFNDGKKKNAHGQALLDQRNTQKRRAALKDPETDTSRENAAKAAAEWRESA